MGDFTCGVGLASKKLILTNFRQCIVNTEPQDSEKKGIMQEQAT
jgi:hypothetical protein